MLIGDCRGVREKEPFPGILKGSYTSYKSRFKSCPNSFLQPKVFGFVIELVDFPQLLLSTC